MYNALTKSPEALVGEDGELLYVSTFAASNDDWDLFKGPQSAQIVAEQLEIAVAVPHTAAWSATSPRFAEFDATVTAVAHDGPIDNAFGLLFHVENRDEDDCTLPAVLLCGISELAPLVGAALRQVLDQRQTTSYRAFMISSDGYYSLWQTEAGATTALSAWIASPHITQGIGAENTIRIRARDSSYQFFINGSAVQLCIPDDRTTASTYAGGECIDGSLQDTFHDDRSRTGRLGMIAQSTATGGGGLVVRFDDMIVYSPAESGSEDVRL